MKIRCVIYALDHDHPRNGVPLEDILASQSGGLVRINPSFDILVPARIFNDLPSRTKIVASFRSDQIPPDARDLQEILDRRRPELLALNVEADDAEKRDDHARINEIRELQRHIVAQSVEEAGLSMVEDDLRFDPTRGFEVSPGVFFADLTRSERESES